MQRVLFHSTVFGPIKSRRLGTSLGINLSPNDGKVCSFDCLYCEAGFNAQGAGTTGFPSVAKVRTDLEKKLEEMLANGEKPDVITFSGNGEPTLHPQFSEIIDQVMDLRDRYVPEASISVLTNSTMLHKPEVVEALKKIDNPILKLDSAVEDTMRRLDRPNSEAFTVEKVVEQLKQFGHKAIIQTMILQGADEEGNVLDNSTDEEVERLITTLLEIKPRMIMLYSIDRPTPGRNVRKVEKDVLERIADRMRRRGLENISVA